MDSFIWMVVTLGPLIWLQPRLHKEVQVLFLLVTRNQQLTVLFFSLLFLPGVFLHEVSHFLMAKLLRVKTGHFSILPQTKEAGRLQLGYVEVAHADPLRSSLIGAAPLLAGMAAVAYIGFYQLMLDQIWLAGLEGGFASALTAFFAVFNQADVWLWLYLALAVSSTMFPSSSDRRSWIWVVGIGLVLVFILVIAGAGSWLLDISGPGLSRAFFAAAVVFGMASGLHLLLLLPLMLLRRVLLDVMNVEILPQ
ncbi:MAG TPA: hypothetical protein VJ965_05725 [Anaerolineales bacterium]|nr:hypothetical protein [Anaerolineales bacterium]